MQKRIEYIDTAKAIGILLVILGHCKFLYRPELGIFIYSFHMPLFFVISGMFVKPLSISNGIMKYVKAYVRPYFITCFIMFVITVTFLYFNIGNSNGVNIALQRILMGKGSQEGMALFHDFPNVGAIWFFLALFWGCLFYSIIKLKAKSYVDLCLYSFTLFFLGYISAKYLVIPMDLQAGMCSVVFLFIGDVIRHQKIIEHLGRLSKNHIMLMITMWMVVVFFTKDDLNMASCRYDEGFIRIPISIIAILLVFYFCKKLNSYNIKLSRIGNNTLYILIGHQLFNYVCWETGFDFLFLKKVIPPPPQLLFSLNTHYMLCLR